MRNSGRVCGSVGKAVASNTRDPRSKPWHRQNFSYQLFNRKDDNEEKSGPEQPIKKLTETQNQMQRSLTISGFLGENGNHF